MSGKTSLLGPRGHQGHGYTDVAAAGGTIRPPERGRKPFVRPPSLSWAPGTPRSNELPCFLFSPHLTKEAPPPLDSAMRGHPPGAPAPYEDVGALSNANANPATWLGSVPRRAAPSVPGSSPITFGARQEVRPGDTVVPRCRRGQPRRSTVRPGDTVAPDTRTKAPSQCGKGPPAERPGVQRTAIRSNVAYSRTKTTSSRTDVAYSRPFRPRTPGVWRQVKPGIPVAGHLVTHCAPWPRERL